MFNGTTDGANGGRSFSETHVNPPEVVGKLDFSQNFTLGLAVQRRSSVKTVFRHYFGLSATTR